MPDLFSPEDNVPWPAERYYRDAPLWSPSGVVGIPSASYGGGDLGLSFAVSGSVITVRLEPGRARVRGTLYERTLTRWESGRAQSGSTAGGDLSLATPAYPLNTSSNPRRDRLVLRRDLASGQAYPYILQGVPAASPTAPALTRVENGIWDIPMFAWTIAPSSSTAISEILDERLYVMPQIATYTPTLSTPNGTVSVGTGGYSKGWFQCRGDIVDWEVNIFWGTAINTSFGPVRVGLPPGVRGAVDNIGRYVSGTFFYDANSLFPVLALIGASSNNAQPKVPYSGQECRLGDLAAASAAGQTGTGRPYFANDFGIKEGSNLVLSGQFRMA